MTLHLTKEAAPEATEAGGTTPTDAPEPQRPVTRLAQLAQRLFGISLFYKVLIANSALIVLGALAGTAITLRVATLRSPGEAGVYLPLTVTFLAAGLALSILLNALVLRAALGPLNRLQDVVRRVGEGDLSVRAQPTPLADVEIARIAATLNVMLDNVQSYENQVRNLSGALIRAQEDERQRIARELHDDTGQVLTLLLIRLKLLESLPGAEAIQPQIEELRGLIASAIDQVRRLALNLRPPTIDQLGLIPALRSLVATFTESTGLHVSVELPREPITLARERTLAVYRVVQEALTNTAKHAGAQHISVVVRREGDWLVAVIRDDGRGFSPETFAGRHRQPSGGAGVGLFGMEERGRLAGGSLALQSAPGRGASVTLRVPLDAETAETDEHGA
ncbi:MAG TPA: sensor histidine kinase [Ktedonobacterales bacterium]|jgi:two-component system sensor histidine kinase UhpB|nr:sensor histidine kinase [Ktedonobacterales bacterium]